MAILEIRKHFSFLLLFFFCVGPGGGEELGQRGWCVGFFWGCLLPL